MILYTTGNLLEADADALVNTVNCVGVMGKGIALQFKQAFPDIEKSPGIMNLSDVDREILIRWLVNDDRVVFGGQPISGVKKQ